MPRPPACDLRSPRPAGQAGAGAFVSRCERAVAMGVVMSVSRCLGPASDALGGIPRAQWKAYLDALPEACPHRDCTAKPGCRGYVSDYFRMQWRIQMAH